jgi:hypothetical protein
MLVERTIHQGLRVLGNIWGVDGEFTGTLYVAGKITGLLNLEIGTTTWLKGDTAIGVTPTNTTTLTVYGLISIPAGGYTTGLVMEKALDIDIGASTEFDINDGLFRFTDGTNTLRVDDPNGIQLLGQTGVGSTPDALYKLWIEPDDAQIGIGSQNDQTYGPLEDGWAAAPKAAMRITRDVSKYGLSDYAGIMLYAKPTSPHTAQGMIGVYSATPANHHTGLFMAAYSGQWTTILKGSMFGDWHFQTEEDRDIIFHLSQMDSAGYPADAISRFVMGYDYSTTSYIIEAGDAFTASPGIQVKSDNTVRLSSLTGTGVRAVYADASGNLSTPVAPVRDLKMVGFYIDDDSDASTFIDMLVLPQYSVVHNIEVWGLVAFDDPGVDHLEIGHSGNTDYFGLWDIRGKTGVITPNTSTFPIRISSGYTMTAYLTESSSPSNGEVYIYVWYTEASAEDYLDS